jgi:hypothetical protein
MTFHGIPINDSLSKVTELHFTIYIFHATHEIFRSKVLNITARIYLTFQIINERNFSRHLSTNKAIFGIFNNTNHYKLSLKDTNREWF